MMPLPGLQCNLRSNGQAPAKRLQLEGENSVLHDPSEGGKILQGGHGAGRVLPQCARRSSAINIGTCTA